MKLTNERAQVQAATKVEAKPCAWMGPHVPLGNGSNWRRLEQDYEFSDGYGLNAPGDGWTPLYDKAAIAAAVAAERERCAKLQQVLEDTRTQRDELLAHIAGKAPLPHWAADWLRA